MLFFPVEAQTQCYSHEDCSDIQICYQGSCQLACRLQSCGANAICIASNHAARCECLPGFQGTNPEHEGCNGGEFLYTVLKTFHTNFIYRLLLLCMQNFPCFSQEPYPLKKQYRQDAPETMIALTLLHARIPSASIHVQNMIPVPLWQPAEWLVTRLFVHVQMGTLAHLKLNANHVSVTMKE